MRASSVIRPSLRYAAGSACVALILVASGWAVVNHASRVFLVVAILALGLLAVFEQGAFIGILVLGAMNGLPFIDTSRTVASHIAEQDLACLALIAAAIVWTTFAGHTAPATRVARRLSWCGFALFAWCAVIVVKTTVAGDASILGAIRFGRDFLYFGALLMFLPRIRLPERELNVLVAVLLAGVCLFSIGQILTVEGIADPTFLVHASSTGQTLGLTRVFAPMNDLLFAGVAIGSGAVALGRRGKAQRIAIAVTVLLGVSLIVQLTRARWISLVLSIVVVSLWMALQADRRVAVVLRRRVGMAIAAVASAVAAIALVAPGLIATGPLVQRVLSIFTDASSSTNTLVTRQQVADHMTSILGGKWLTGVGLIPPSTHFYLALPAGSLRDPDLGVFNAIMTIGAVGAALIYLPLVVVLVHCMRRVRTRAALAYPWLLYGGQIFIVAAIASSITLITLFSVGGLVLTAVILALLCQPSVSGVDLPSDAGGTRGAAAPAPDVHAMALSETWGDSRLPTHARPRSAPRRVRD